MSSQPCLAVFGGSFDPPHISHVLVPSVVLSQGLAQRVIVVPCWRHPLGKVLSEYSSRLRWVLAAMVNHGTEVEVSRIEEEMVEQRVENSITSTMNRVDKHQEFVATIDLLEEVSIRYPGYRVRMVIGSDIVQTAETNRWTRWGDICSRFSPIVIPRAGYSDATQNVELPEISSTEIRKVWGQSNWIEQSEFAQKIPHRVRNILASREQGAPRIWLIGNGVASRHLNMWLEERGFHAPIVGGRDLVAGTAVRPQGSDPQGIWFMVPEKSIKKCAQALADSNWFQSACPVVHGSGSILANDALKPLADQGHPVATVHPICSLRPELRSSLIRECAFGVEGDDFARQWAFELIGHQPVIDLQSLNANDRYVYHAACALLANHTAVPFDSAAQAMREIGLDPLAVEVALQVLGQSAWKNLQQIGIPGGISGPMVRGDLETVQKHIDALSSVSHELYRTLSEHLAKILKRYDSR